MQDKLKWNAIGLVKKTGMLKDYIEREKINVPIDHTKKRATLSGFLVELNHILEQMEKIKKIIIPKLENLFRLTFPTPKWECLPWHAPAFETSSRISALILRKMQTAH